MNISVEFASPEDDEGIRRLLRRQTMTGRVQLALGREPDFSLGCTVTGDDHRILLARTREGGDIVGVACRSMRDVFLNGRQHRVGYLGQLRVDDRFRGRWLVSRGFALLEELDGKDSVPAYLASIVEGNDEAVGVLVRRPRRSYPAFREVARYRTLAIRVRRSKPASTGPDEIVPGSSDQLADLVRFLRTEGARRQLFSVWTEQRLRDLDAFGLRLADIRIARRHGAIVGAMALWDQSAYKQWIVRGYTGWLKALAPILPRVGDEVRSAYVSLVCIAHDDVAVFSRLLRDVYNLGCSRRFDYLLVGLDSRDPLLTGVGAYRRFCYASRLYLASWSHGGHAHEPLDGRPAYVDIATL